MPEIDDNEEVVVVNQTEEKPKIGFTTYDRKKKIKRFQENLPGKGLRRATKIFIIPGVILSIFTAMYFLLPFFSTVIGVFLAFLIIMFMIASIVFTLGIILTVGEYRTWIGYHMMDLPNFFFDIGSHIDQVSPFFPVLGFSAIGFTFIALILSIVGAATKKKYFASYIVVAAIFLVVAIFFTICFYGNGGHTIVTSSVTIG